MLGQEPGVLADLNDGISPTILKGSRLLSARLLAEQAVDGAVLSGLVPRNAYAKYALPKGLPKEGQRTLAIQNDPHTVEDFDGVIESGYGAGTKTLLSNDNVVVKCGGRTFVGKWNFHHHDAKVAGPHYDLVVEGLTEELARNDWELNVPRGEFKGRYAFTHTKQGIVVTPMKDRTVLHAKPQYQLKAEEILDKVKADPKNWIVEQKLDGSLGNVLIREGRAHMRSHRDNDNRYIDKLPALEFLYNTSPLMIWRKLFPVPDLNNTEMQVELVHEDGVSRVAGILNAHPGKARETQALRGPVKAYAWDIVRLRGKDVSSLPYRQRRALLEEAIDEIRLFNKNWFAIPKMTQGDDPHRFYQEILEQPLPFGEGIVVKNANDPRGETWIKCKAKDYNDLEVIGFVEGRNRLSGSLGTLVVMNPVTGATGEVGTGMTDYERQWIWGSSRDAIWIRCQSRDDGRNNIRIFPGSQVQGASTKEKAIPKPVCCSMPSLWRAAIRRRDCA